MGDEPRVLVESVFGYFWCTTTAKSDILPPNKAANVHYSLEILNIQQMGRVNEIFI